MDQGFMDTWVTPLLISIIITILGYIANKIHQAYLIILANASSHYKLNEVHSTSKLLINKQISLEKSVAENNRILTEINAKIR